MVSSNPASYNKQKMCASSFLLRKSSIASKIIKNIQIKRWNYTPQICLSIKILFVLSFLRPIDAIKDENCKICSLLEETFRYGMEKTQGQHFGGGDTAWEEKNLGKYATSEVRLFEIMEHCCKMSDSSKKGDVVGNLDKIAGHKCHSLMEQHEDLIENWYYYKQISNPDLHKWLCIDHLKACCSEFTFGPECKSCPGDPYRPCSGRGSCQGAGTRSGSGTCICDPGYIGLLCRKCDANYFIAEQNDTFLLCRECHQSCKNGCTTAEPTGCKQCRPGWTWNAGCTDIDECLGQPCDAHEDCANSPGSYSCQCQDGYRKDGGKCELIPIEDESVEQTELTPADGVEKSEL